MDKRCSWCDSSMMIVRADARFCSTKCRMRDYRKRRKESAPASIPKQLCEIDRWVRWSPVRRGEKVAKRPITVTGRSASSTDSRTWSSYSDAVDSNSGAGLGFVLNGDGIACVDLDDVITEGVLDFRARLFLQDLRRVFFLEVSQSGRGLHAWTYGASPAGHPVFETEDGLKVEWYSDERFIALGTPIKSLEDLNT